MNKLLVTEGFPVKIEVPISFSIEAVVTFLVHRKLEEDSNMECFAIPKFDYGNIICNRSLNYVHRKVAQKTIER